MKEAQGVSSGVLAGMERVAQLLQGKETACEHLRNAQAVAQGLVELLDAKGLTALAGDVRAVERRLVQALTEIAAGNLGRP